MDCSLLYATTSSILEQGFFSSRNMLDFNQNVIGNLSQSIKSIINKNPLLKQSEKSQDCKEYIRKAIVDFYRKNGMNTFVHFVKDDKIEISTSIRDKNNNIYVFFLSKWLEENKKKFKSKMTDSNDNFSQEEFKMILQYAKLCIDFDDDLLFRDIVRSAIKKTFNLNTRDGLFFSQIGMYFKMFDFEFVKISNEIRNIKKLNSARLLNDEDRQKINAYLNKYNVNAIILKSVSNILDKKVNLNVISNIEFTKTFLFYVAQELRIEIQKILGNNIPSIVQTCYSEEKVRNSKNLIFEKVADRVLKLAYEDLSGAKNFINFYNGQTIHIDNQIIPIPAIIDQKGEKWTAQRIQNVLEQKFSVQTKIDNLRKQGDKIAQNILKTETKINEFQQEITLKNAKLDKLDASYEEKKRELHNLKEETMLQKETISTELGKFLDHKKILINELEALNQEINNLRKEKNILINEEKKHQSTIEDFKQNNQVELIQYDMLVNALSNAIGGVNIETNQNI